MPIRNLVFILLAIFSGLQLFAQVDNNYVKVPSNFKTQWEHFEKLGGNGLPIKQIALLDSIIQVSLQQKNAPELHRALSVYPFVIRETMMESDLKHEKLENFEILSNKLESPYSNILHSFLVDQFQRYPSNWNLNNWGEDFSIPCNVDGKTVYFTKNRDEQQLIINHHYRKSIENFDVLLQQKSMDFANSMLAEATYYQKNPTLANIIAYRFLDHFTSESKNEFDPQWYANSEEFLKKSTLEVLKVYQDLELYHWKNKQLDAYTNWVLFRLDFVQRASGNEINHNKLFLEALQQLKNRLNGHPSTLGVVLTEAQTKLNDPANQYEWKSKPENANKKGEVHTLLVESLKLYPTSLYSGDVKNVIKGIESRTVNISFAKAYALGKPNLMTVKYKNVNSAFLTIYHIDEGPNSKDWSSNPLSNNKLSKVHGQQLVLNDNGKYNYHSKDFIVPELNKSGNYLFLITATEDSASIVLQLETLEKSNVAYAQVALHKFNVVRNYNSADLEIIVLNEADGSPLAGAKVFGRTENNPNFDLMGVTNAKGEFNLYLEGGELKVVHGGDSIIQSVYTDYYGDFEPENRYRMITDRNIYRPGQTVHFKAYAFDGKSPDYKVMVGHEVEIRMINHVGIDEVVASGKTNEFGTFSGTFVLPKSIRTGEMYLMINDQSSVNILVEEYKRPSFEIDSKFDKETYKLGDKVTITGKVLAFAGYGLAHSKVQVRIDYSAGYRYYYGEEENLMDTIIQTDAQGAFSFSFIAKTKEENRFGASFSYDLSATSMSGETQTKFESVFIGRSRSEWDVHLPSQVLSTDAGIGVIALMEEEPKTSTKTIEVQLWKTNPKYIQPSMVFAEHEFHEFSAEEFNKRFPDAVYFGQVIPQFILSKTLNVQSGDSISIHQLVNRIPGNYEVRLTYRSDIDTISLVQRFNYIDMKSKKNQHKADLWSAVADKLYKPGDVATVVIGSKYKKLNVLLEIHRGNELLRHEWIKVKGRKTIQYTVQPQDLGGVQIFAYSMKEGDFLETSCALHVPFDSKNLNVKLETAREILRPGAEEKWIVSVSSSDGSPLTSELLAGMYDASLDMFTYNDWNMSVYEQNYSSGHWSFDFQDIPYFNVSGKWDGRDGYYSGYNSERLQFNREGGYYDGFVYSTTMGSTQAFSTNANTTYLFSDETALLKETEMSPPKDIKPMDKVRTNFNETAFFYPQLTAKDNKFQFEFTLPDALTRWKFQALAHDKLMRFGYTSNTFIAQKELMVDPNEPRFFRAGDDFVFAVNLVNLTEKSQNVTATLEWFDPFTNIVIPNVLGIMPNQQVTLDAKGMKTVNWNLKIPKTGLELIAYRVKVASGEFSDTEEKVIPVLSNRTQNIESVPITVDGKGQFSYELPKLLNQSSATQRNEKLVFEYNSNPLWSAVMAIPYITDYPYDCAEQVFSKFFANRISQAIVTQNPLIEKALTAPETNSPDKFLSALETNEDLKSIVLAETPWVLEAKSESEQRRRIAQLFETNNLQMQEQLNLEKLQQMQNPDGGWSWFAGGKSNVYITQHILSGFGHLRALGLEVDVELINIELAQKFLENEYSKQFKVLQKGQIQKSEGLTSLHVQWLYMKALLGTTPSAASTYYASCLEHEWLKFPLHIQSLAGVYFKQTKNEAMQQKIYKSILSKATTRKGLGTYWNENQNSWSWDRNAIETQASLIEFFKMSGADEKTLASMKLWLLNQKRGQYWESTKTTAWACYALLIDSKPVKTGLSTEKIYLGNDEFTSSASGYLRKTYSGSEIKPEMGKVTISQSAEEPAFGSLNLIYTEEIGKISKNNSGMQLEKQIYVVRDGKETLLTPASKLMLGDLLRVKLQITSDRNLEFVHVKDLRASGTENVETLSAYRSSGNLYYYNANKDASTEFFLDNLPKGKHTITYDMRVSGKGTQSTGYAIVECLYAPEFRANSASDIIVVE